MVFGTGKIGGITKIQILIHIDDIFLIKAYLFEDLKEFQYAFYR